MRHSRIAHLSLQVTSQTPITLPHQENSISASRPEPSGCRRRPSQATGFRLETRLPGCVPSITCEDTQIACGSPQHEVILRRGLVLDPSGGPTVPYRRRWCGRTISRKEYCPKPVLFPRPEPFTETKRTCRHGGTPKGGYFLYHRRPHPLASR